MTASERKPGQGISARAGDGAATEIDLVDRACRTVIEGRRAARAMAPWCRRFGLSEPGFQVLWCLRAMCGEGLDQSTLAGRLALSPAQVSTMVERLRAQRLIAQRHVPGDRRRRLWQLSSGGHALLQQLLADTKALRNAECGMVSSTPQSAIRNPHSDKEAA